jgi:hypothetical protein
MFSLIVLAIVLALVVVAAVTFVAVIIGIHSEPHSQMTITASRPLAAVVRRLLGVHVCKPADLGTKDREKCLAGGQSSDWWNEAGGNR